VFGAFPFSLFFFAHLPFLHASLAAVAGGLSVTKHIYIYTQTALRISGYLVSFLLTTTHANTTGVNQ
jgi:hypothetical protein